jgi:hypothetical protein
MKAFEVTLAAVIAAAGCSATPETFDESIIGSEEQEIYCEDCGGGGDPGGAAAATRAAAGAAAPWAGRARPASRPRSPPATAASGWSPALPAPAPP